MREPFLIPSPGDAALDPAARGPLAHLLTEARRRLARGDFDQALPLCRRAWEEAGEARVLRGHIASTLTDVLAGLGELDEAIDWADRALALFRQGGDERLTLLARERRAFYLSWAGRADTAAVEAADLVTELRGQAERDPRLWPDLARGLDHLAEILERGHRLEEACRAAGASTALRRETGDPVPLLWSLVTLARLRANLGQATEALDLCAEAEALAGGEPLPPALRAPIASLHGRLLLAAGRAPEGEPRLREGARLFRRLAREGDGSALFRDALAEVLLDLGRLWMATDPARARGCFLRALVWKRRIERDHPHPFHRAGLARTLVCLGRAEQAMGRRDEARRCIDRAIALYHELEPVPGDFTETALRLTRMLTVAAAPGGEAETRRFRLLAETFVRAIELTDAAVIETQGERQQGFQRLWLGHFIDGGNANGLLAVLAFAHGQRLARLAREERRCSAAPAPPGEVQAWLRLRRDLIRQDMEQAEIPLVPPSLPLAGANYALERLRHRRYRDYLRLRDRLLESGHSLPGATGLPRLPAPPAPGEPALAVWCVPEALGVARRPKLILFLPGERSPRLIPVPELPQAHAAYERFLAARPPGRGPWRGLAQPAIDRTPAGGELWRWMERLWSRIRTAVPDAARLDLVTHAQAHNLPWLGSCPEGLRLRQYPSLHFQAHRRAPPAIPPPSPERPLLLALADDPGNPLDRLPFAPLEAAAIRLIWPGAVVEAPRLDASGYRSLAALWFIGHGLNDRGQPLWGNGNGQPLVELPPLARLEGRIGLIYASTCYLGQTTDVEGEPAGLPGLAALRHEPPLTIGAVAPVDDFGSALLAILFHLFWKENGDPRQAFDRARSALAGGDWPDGARALLRRAGEIAAPGIRHFAEGQALIGQGEIARHRPGLPWPRRLALQHRIRRQGQECLRRLDSLDDPDLPRLVAADGASETARLWAMLG